MVQSIVRRKQTRHSATSKKRFGSIGVGCTMESDILPQMVRPQHLFSTRMARVSNDESTIRGCGWLVVVSVPFRVPSVFVSGFSARRQQASGWRGSWRIWRSGLVDNLYSARQPGPGQSCGEACGTWLEPWLACSRPWGGFSQVERKLKVEGGIGGSTGGRAVTASSSNAVLGSLFHNHPPKRQKRTNHIPGRRPLRMPV
jgi:hypothetical protein